MLDSLPPTSTGPELRPAWFLKFAAPLQTYCIPYQPLNINILHPSAMVVCLDITDSQSSHTQKPHRLQTYINHLLWNALLFVNSCVQRSSQTNLNRCLSLISLLSVPPAQPQLLLFGCTPLPAFCLVMIVLYFRRWTSVKPLIRFCTSPFLINLPISTFLIMPITAGL